MNIMPMGPKFFTNSTIPQEVYEVIKINFNKYLIDLFLNYHFFSYYLQPMSVVNKEIKFSSKIQTDDSFNVFKK